MVLINSRKFYRPNDTGHLSNSAGVWYGGVVQIGSITKNPKILVTSRIINVRVTKNIHWIAMILVTLHIVSWNLVAPDSCLISQDPSVTIFGDFLVNLATFDTNQFATKITFWLLGLFGFFWKIGKKLILDLFFVLWCKYSGLLNGMLRHR